MPRSAGGSSGLAARSRQRPRVRCARNGRTSFSKPAARADRSQACCRSRMDGGTSSPSHSTRGLPRSGNRPSPATRASAGGHSAAAAASRGRSLSTWAGEVSPRKRRVRWMPSGRTRRMAPSRGRRPACSSPMASRSGGSSSTATNARAWPTVLTAAAGPAGRAAASRAPPAWPGSARARGRRGRGCAARGCPPRRRRRRTRGPRASRRCPRPGPRSR